MSLYWALSVLILVVMAGQHAPKLVTAWRRERWFRQFRAQARRSAL